MPLQDWPTPAEFQALFAEEVAAAGGTVSDTFADGTRLFTRSVLPRVREVRARDGLQGGVALKATGEEVWVHPYVFRLVCRNGAIRAHALQARHVAGPDFVTGSEAAGAVRAALRDCCAGEAFAEAVDELRSAAARQADFALDLLPLLSHLPPATGAQVARQVMERFFQEADRSRFALTNAVTALARDTADPELRWRLEEFGGAVPVARPPEFRPDGAAHAVLVG